MSVKVGSARIDENGNAKGGKAGDQTGKEVSAQTWYKHSKGWRVFRANNSACAEKIAQDMKYACANNNIGYDQNQRNTLYNVAKKVGFNCSKVTQKCETDCSALVRVCCAYAGILLPNFRTATEPNVLLKSGKFTELKGKKYTDSPDYLLAGDILVTKKSGHTVVVLNNGSKAKPIKETKGTVIVIRGSVNVRKKPNKEGQIIGVAYRGEEFPYIGKTDNNWYEIYYGVEPAYISGRYTEYKPPE